MAGNRWYLWFVINLTFFKKNKAETMSFVFVIVINNTPVFDTEFGARSPAHAKDTASASSQVGLMQQSLSSYLKL